MKLTGILPLPGDGELIEFLQERRGLPRDARRLLSSPVIQDPNDAVWVAVHCVAQDDPAFFIAGSLLSIGMLLTLFYRGVMILMS